jgi:hypothetical protein
MFRKAAKPFPATISDSLTKVCYFRLNATVKKTLKNEAITIRNSKERYTFQKCPLLISLMVAGECLACIEQYGKALLSTADPSSLDEPKLIVVPDDLISLLQILAERPGESLQIGISTVALSVLTQNFPSLNENQITDVKTLLLTCIQSTHHDSMSGCPTSRCS